MKWLELAIEINQTIVIGSWLFLMAVFLYFAFGTFFKFEKFSQWSSKRKRGFVASIIQVLICVTAFIFSLIPALESQRLGLIFSAILLINFCFIPCGLDYFNERIPFILRNVLFLIMAMMCIGLFILLLLLKIFLGI